MVLIENKGVLTFLQSCSERAYSSFLVIEFRVECVDDVSEWREDLSRARLGQRRDLAVSLNLDLECNRVVVWFGASVMCVT